MVDLKDAETNNLLSQLVFTGPNCFSISAPQLTRKNFKTIHIKSHDSSMKTLTEKKLPPLTLLSHTPEKSNNLNTQMSSKRVSSFLLNDSYLEK